MIFANPPMSSNGDLVSCEHHGPVASLQNTANIDTLPNGCDSNSLSHRDKGYDCDNALHNYSRPPNQAILLCRWCLLPIVLFLLHLLVLVLYHCCTNIGFSRVHAVTTATLYNTKYYSYTSPGKDLVSLHSTKPAIDIDVELPVFMPDNFPPPMDYKPNEESHIWGAHPIHDDFDIKNYDSIKLL